MFNQIDKIIDYESGVLDEDETLTLFQDLVRTGLVWQLQGHYGRIANHLIQEGLIEGGQRGSYQVSWAS